ncbi:MAG: response regulator transcription factor [Candidatus Xenobia bacterium]
MTVKAAHLARILVVDDDVQIRRALMGALAARNYDVVLAGTGEEALALAPLDPPDMIILDLSLPGRSGLEVCQELRRWTQAPILVLSVKDRPNDKVEALDLGADDYLTKPFNTAELLARIRSHLRRAQNLPCPEPVIEVDGLTIDLARYQVFRNGEEVKLTRTEFALLQYLAQHAGRVVTYNLLLQQVWGQDGGDTQTLRVHIGHLRRKIEVDADRPRLIVTEPGVGYRFLGGGS